MFVGETNFLYSRHYIKTIFSTVNEELEKLGGWFTANRLSLNIKKTKYTFFHKNAVKDNIPLKLLDLSHGTIICMPQKKSLSKISALYTNIQSETVT